MSNLSKRHHWWPQLQSKRWCGKDGLLNVVSREGNVFRATPYNVGLEGHLYTRTDELGASDTRIETWLSDKIDGPFDRVFDEAFNLTKVIRVPFQGDERRKKQAEALGFIINPRYVEELNVLPSHRRIIANYVASLLVRNPHYLLKLSEFHKENAKSPSEREIKSRALDNMLRIFALYRSKIFRAEWIIEAVEGSQEYFFGDAGVVADEPWGDSFLPFDLHVPLTPKLALEVLPVAKPLLKRVGLTRVRNAVVTRHNRSVLSDAKRFVFTKSAPPVDFIRANFGVPAPAPFGHRVVNGELEIRYFQERDFPARR